MSIYVQHFSVKFSATCTYELHHHVLESTGVEQRFDEKLTINPCDYKRFQCANKEQWITGRVVIV